MEPTKEIGFKVNTLSHAIKRKLDACIAQTDPDGTKHVTGVQGRLLGYLHRHGEEDVFQRDIEREFQIRRSTATEILQLMERNGLIWREPVDYDARLKKLHLTSKAMEMSEFVHQRILEIEQQLRQSLTEEETMVLLRLLEKVQKSLEQPDNSSGK